MVVYLYVSAVYFYGECEYYGVVNDSLKSGQVEAMTIFTASYEKKIVDQSRRLIYKFRLGIRLQYLLRIHHTTEV